MWAGRKENIVLSNITSRLTTAVTCTTDGIMLVSWSLSDVTPLTVCPVLFYLSDPLPGVLFPPCRFSTDEGQCWRVYNFTSEPVHFSGMDSEPGARSMNISLWGFRDRPGNWVVVTIDFRQLLNIDCECVCVCVWSCCVRL